MRHRKYHLGQCIAAQRRLARAAETRFRIRAARGAGTQARGLELLASLSDDFMQDGRKDTPPQVREDLRGC